MILLMRISELEEDIFTRAIPLGTDTVSLTTLDSAVEWYTACSSHHDRCNLPFNEHRGWPPTRLIDIGGKGDDL